MRHAPHARRLTPLLAAVLTTTLLAACADGQTTPPGAGDSCEAYRVITYSNDQIRAMNRDARTWRMLQDKIEAHNVTHEKRCGYGGGPQS